MDISADEEKSSMSKVGAFLQNMGVTGDFRHLNMKDPFLIKEKNSKWYREIRAGTVTFLTMAYILPINSNLLSIAIPNSKEDLVIATAAAACCGSVMMGVLSNFPFGLAPGMGTNAYFTFTVVLTYGVAWQDALTAVFFSGIFFTLLSVFGVRTLIVRLLPRGVQVAMGAGIGIFLCFIGMQSSQGIGVVKAHPETLVTLNTPLTVNTNYDAYKMWLSAAVLIFTSALLALKVPGAPLAGILFGTLVAWSECWATKDNSVFNYPFAACSPGMNATAFADAGCFCYAPERVAAAGKITNTAAAFQWNQLDTSVFWVSVFTFLYTDILDSSGTFFAVAKRAGYVDKYGNLPKGNANMAYLSDAVGTIIGSCLGTSTITTFVESSAGVVDGGRTGLTAITVGLWFAFAIPFAPMLGKIPPLASGPILCVVGALMMKNIQGFDWGDVEEAIPAFCVLVMIPLTYNISYGIIGGTFLWIIMQVLLMPYRLYIKQDPFIKFKMLLGPEEETAKEFDNASIINQPGNVVEAVEYGSGSFGKPDEQIEMQSLRDSTPQ